MQDLASDQFFHAEALRDYLLCWESAEHRRRRGVSESEAAYHVLEHAGYLDRHGPPSWVAELRQLPAEDRRALVLAACRYTEGMTWAQRARRLLAAEALSAEAFEEMEDLLLRRDALETVWTVARGLADDLLQADPPLRRVVALSRCVAAEIDEQLAGRPDVVSVAAEVLARMPPPLPAPSSLSEGWWFASIGRLSDEYAQPLPIRRVRPAEAAPPLRFEADPQYALAAATSDDETVYRLAAVSGEKLQMRAFPRDSSKRVYTLALEPVPTSKEAVVLLDGEPIEQAAPPEYLAEQQLLFLFVTEAVHGRLSGPAARRSVELRQRPEPGKT